MRGALATIVLAVAMGFPTASPGATGQSCGRHGSVMQDLWRIYQERLIATGVSDAGPLIEVYARADGGTWSIVEVWPDGTACLVASGVDWRERSSSEEDPAA